MGVERQGQRRPLPLTRSPHHGLQKSPVPDMMPIEVSDRRDWIGPHRLAHISTGDSHRSGQRSSLAASLAKYERMMSAPARLIANSDSIMARDSSSQPAFAAALIMLYSPLTW
jgi:hypothetical protein